MVSIFRRNKQLNKKLSRLQKILRPSVFQGHLQKKIYFEGWYYKICSADENHILAIIPGVALNKKNNKSHAFIQILDGNTAEYNYLRFPLEDFRFTRVPHRIEIGPNEFTEKNLAINLRLPNKTILKGTLEFDYMVPLKTTIMSPGIMGPLSFLPFLETYHGILSMNHSIRGKLDYLGASINFSGGKGYIEKDWGKMFPSQWVWMQSNHFGETDRSFIFSIAKIPYLGIKFNGFLAVFWDRGTEYRFTSYNGAKLQSLVLQDTEITFTLVDRKKRVKMTIHAIKPEKYEKPSTTVMMTPVNGEMVAKCAETMKAMINLRFISPSVSFSDIGKNAGVEIMATRGTFKNAEKVANT